MLAYCGLTCRGCQIYLATREEDEEERARMWVEIARLCMEHYGTELKPEEISDCDGCRTKGGRLFSGCRNCSIRQCASQKGLENCAQCEEYACERLEKFFTTDPAAKTRLDAVRRGL